VAILSNQTVSSTLLVLQAKKKEKVNKGETLFFADHSMKGTGYFNYA
jgi:hypothetical protein